MVLQVEAAPKVHNDKYVIQSIENAKDEVGVLNADNLQNVHRQISELTRDDWQRATQLFPKHSDLPDEFFIAADGKGDFIIHNDMNMATRADALSTAHLEYGIAKSDVTHLYSAFKDAASMGATTGGV